MLEQCVPARIGLSCRAAAGTLVEVGPTGGAQSFAIFPAFNISRSGQKPGLPYRRAKVKHSLVRIVEKDVRIVRFLRANLGEKEVDIFIDPDIDLFQTKTARKFYVPFDPTG